MTDGLDQAEVEVFRDALAADLEELLDEAVETGEIGDPGELERLASLLSAGLRDGGAPPELAEALASLLEQRSDEAAAALLSLIPRLVPSFSERSSTALACLARVGVSAAVPRGAGELRAVEVRR